MPSIATWVRPSTVSFIRHLPAMRGRGRLAKTINDALLGLGADPHQVSKMSAGHFLKVDCRLFSHCLAPYTGTTGNDDLVEVLVHYLHRDGIALDVGANVGFITTRLAVAAQELGARVISVEPFQQNTDWLAENLRLNHLEEVVTVVPVGLSSSPGAATLLLREDFFTGSSIGNASVAENDKEERFQKVTIRLETLDALWDAQGYGRLDVVKVDIEGHEDRFLIGGARTLAANRPVIMMEVNRWFYQQRGVEFDSVIPPLLPPGYRFFVSASDEIKSLADCHRGDVLLVPEEKVAMLNSAPRKG